MTETSCAVGECDRPSARRGWCITHYRRWKRTGDVGGPIRLWQPGRVCSVGTCDRPNMTDGLCRTHYMRWYHTGNVRPDVPIDTRGTDDIGYSGAHARVKKARGFANEHDCAHCSTRRATMWAYDHADLAEKVAHSWRGKADVYYSLDPDHYLALCGPCHKRFDLLVAPVGTRPATLTPPVASSSPGDS